MDVAPKQKTTPHQKIAQFLRCLGGSDGERRMAFASLERTMRNEGVSWSDVGNAYERFAGSSGEGGYSEAELVEFAQASRAEGVEIGIKIGMARVRGGNGGGGGNGHLTLPSPLAMAEFCDDQAGRLKDDRQREFVADMVLMARRGVRLSLGRLGYLASIYIQIGGRT